MRTKELYSCIRFIYLTIPPTSQPEGSRTLPELNSSNVTKLLLKACIHYHPDKYVALTFTNYSLEDTRFLSSEIFKRINHFYAKFKV